MGHIKSILRRISCEEGGSAGKDGKQKKNDWYVRIQCLLCTALDYLHFQTPPIIFRDLKPSNIMITEEGHLYLIDFGIARYFMPGKQKGTCVLGSPGYAAPEQYGRAQTTAKADIFALGALLHQLFTRDDPSESPFQFKTLEFGSGERLRRAGLASVVAPILSLATLLLRIARLAQSRRHRT